MTALPPHVRMHHAERDGELDAVTPPQTKEDELRFLLRSIASQEIWLEEYRKAGNKKAADGVQNLLNKFNKKADALRAEIKGEDNAVVKARMRKIRAAFTGDANIPSFDELVAEYAELSNILQRDGDAPEDEDTCPDCENGYIYQPWFGRHICPTCNGKYRTDQRSEQERALDQWQAEGKETQESVRPL